MSGLSVAGLQVRVRPGETGLGSLCRRLSTGSGALPGGGGGAASPETSRGLDVSIPLVAFVPAGDTET